MIWYACRKKLLVPLEVFLHKSRKPQDVSVGRVYNPCQKLYYLIEFQKCVKLKIDGNFLFLGRILRTFIEQKKQFMKSFNLVGDSVGEVWLVISQ